MRIRALPLIALPLALSLSACGDDAGSTAPDTATTADSGADTTTDTAMTDGATTDVAAADGTLADAPDGATTDAPDATTATGTLVLVAGRLPVDLTADGNLAVLWDPASPVGDIYGYDTNTGDQTLLTALGDPALDMATGVAGTGRVSALHGTPVEAGVWDTGLGWTDIASPFHDGCDANVGGAFDVSDDGAVVVGSFWNGCTTEAFAWSDAGGTEVVTRLQVLGASAEGSALGPVNRASVVSDDGKVIGGFAQLGNIDRSPALWSPDGTGHLLTPDDHDNPGEILALSDDGEVVAGVRGNNAFTWTALGGFVDLGKPENGLPTDQTIANVVAGHGRLVFGTSGDPFFGLMQAFVWTADGGARVLQDLVAAAGVAIPEGVLLVNVLGASSDGSILLGTAMDSLGATSTFVLTLATSAYGI